MQPFIYLEIFKKGFRKLWFNIINKFLHETSMARSSLWYTLKFNLIALTEFKYPFQTMKQSSVVKALFQLNQHNQSRELFHNLFFSQREKTH